MSDNNDPSAPAGADLALDAGDLPLNQLDSAEFQDRTADEIVLLNKQFRGDGYGRTYIAPPAPGHDVHGVWHYFPAHTRSGYAAHAVALHKLLLDEMGIPTSLVPHRLNGLDIDQFPPDRADMLVKWMADAVGLPEVMVTSLPPDLGMADMVKALVNYVAFEGTSVSEHAAMLVNDDRLAALWCVSEFTARAYIAGGVRPEKVSVVRPPICDGPWKDMFRPLDEIHVGKYPNRPTFIMGTLGTWHERKGFHDLVRAYFKNFKREEPVELHIRTSTFDSKLTIKKFEEKVIAEIAKIAKEEFGDADYPASKKQPKIKLLTGTALTDAEVISWLGTLDCYVNPSFGEGLGIPHMWALAQGVPLVSSDFGAVGEFLCDFPHPGIMLATRLTPVPVSMRGHQAIFGPMSHWGSYDVDDLGRAMRSMPGQPLVPGMSTRQRAMAAYVREYFSYRDCRPSLEAALAKVCDPEMIAKWSSDHAAKLAASPS